MLSTRVHWPRVQYRSSCRPTCHTTIAADRPQLVPKIRLIALVIWVALVIGLSVLYGVRPELLEPERVVQTLRGSGESLLLGYVVLSIVRAFTLVPSTVLIIVGTLLFPDRPWFVMTSSLGGVVLSAVLIYYYFESKEDLFRACIEDAITQAEANYDNLKGIHAGGDPVDLIEDWFDTNIEKAATIRKLVKIMIDYAGSETQFPSIDRMIKQFYDIEVDILSTSIRTGVENGLFRAVDAVRAALFVSSHLDGIMVASMIRPDFEVKPAVADLRRHLWEYLGYGGDNHGPGS